MRNIEPKFLPSELHGLQAIPIDAMHVYSVGVNATGAAEIRLAEQNPCRTVIATTLDRHAVAGVETRARASNVANQITVKIEDVSRPLPYEDATFGFIYARLVLHYLSKQRLALALNSLHRVLQPGGQLYVVVRSQECPDYTDPAARHDSATGLSALRHNANDSRFYHTQETISGHLARAGLSITHIAQYDERLYTDLDCTRLAPYIDNVIEVHASRPG